MIHNKELERVTGKKQRIIITVSRMVQIWWLAGISWVSLIEEEEDCHLEISTYLLFNGHLPKFGI